MKKEIFLEGKRGEAAGTLRGIRLRTVGAAPGAFTFEEKRAMNASRETAGRTREGAE